MKFWPSSEIAKEIGQSYTDPDGQWKDLYASKFQHFKKYSEKYDGPTLF